MWKSLAAAEEALEAEVFFSKRAWVDVDRNGSLGDILVHGGSHGCRAGEGEADPAGTSATTVEHAPVPQIPEETVEVALTPDGASATTDCRCANASGVGRGTVGVARLVPHVRVQQRTAEQIESVPRLPEEVVEEVVTLVPREREQQRTVESTRVPQSREETVEVPMPQIADETVQRVQQRTAEQLEDVPQFREGTVEVTSLAPHERVQFVDRQANGVLRQGRVLDQDRI